MFHRFMIWLGYVSREYADATLDMLAAAQEERSRLDAENFRLKREIDALRQPPKNGEVLYRNGSPVGIVQAYGTVNYPTFPGDSR